MKFLLYTDIHTANIYPYNIKESVEDGSIKYTRVEELYSTLKWIKRVVEENDISITINLGDTFNQALRLDTDRYTSIAHLLNDIHSSTKLKIGYINEGNHDRDEQKNASAIEAFKYHPNTIVARNIVRTQYISEINSHIVIVPYIRDKARVKSLFDKLYEKYRSFQNVYLFCHLDIQEMYADTGIGKENIQKYCTYDELNLGTYKAVFNGHLHTEKEFKNIICIGSSIANTFSDIKTGKRIVILDISPKGYTTEKVENPYSPIFVNFNINNQEETVSTIRYIKDQKSLFTSKNVYAKILLTNTQTNRKKLDMFLEKFSSLFTFYEIKFLADIAEIKEEIQTKDDVGSINITDIIISQSIQEMKNKEFNEEKIEKYIGRFKEVANVN